MKPVPKHPHLHLANRVLMSNVWVLEDATGRRFLVDTGHGLERLTLRRALWRHGIRGRGDLAGVVLTHRHSDHAGNAAWVRETYGCPVAVHRDDAGILNGTLRPPRLARGQALLHEEILCRVEDAFPAHSPVDDVFADGESLWGFRVFHVPGHTEGSAMLHHEATGVLFSGDALLTGLPALRVMEWPRLAVAGFSLDVERCRSAVRRVLKELPRTSAVAAGHGPPIWQDAQPKLLKLSQGQGSGFWLG